MRAKRILWLSILLMSNAVLSDVKPQYQQWFETAKPDEEALRHSADLLKEHKDVPIQEKPLIQTFHKQTGALETSPNVFCRTCHGPLPHGKHLRTRAFMNMHVRFIACETCHFRPDQQKFDYRWFDYSEKRTVDGSGLFRLTHDIDNGKQRPDNPKIAPFFDDQPAFVLKDSIFGKSIADTWKTAGPREQIELRAKIHLPLEKKGPDCQACHTTQNGMLELQKLGATPKEAEAMQKHVIPQFFKRYDKDDQRITIRDMLR